MTLVRQLVRLAVPVALGRLGIVSMGVVDTIVVGQLASDELAHLGLGWTLNGPALHGGIGLLLGVQILAARAFGAGRPDIAQEIWRRGLVVATVAGAIIFALIWLFRTKLFAAFGIDARFAEASAGVALVLALSLPLHLAFVASTNFLEAMKRPTPAAIAMWSANAVNLGLNLALVPGWGAIGSAWSTVLSRLFLFGALAIYILRLDFPRSPPAHQATPLTTGYRAILAIGVAAALSAMVESGAFAALGVIAARQGETELATFQISTGGLVTLAFMIALGLSTAAAVLVSQALGRNASGEAARVGWAAIGLTAVAMIVCGGICVVFSDAVARGFSADLPTIMTLTAVMPLVALLMIPDGGQGVVDAVLRAGGDNWFPTAARTVAFIVIAPLLAFWLAEHEGLGIAGILTALVVVSFLAYGAVVVRFAMRAGVGAAFRRA